MISWSPLAGNLELEPTGINPVSIKYGTDAKWSYTMKCSSVVSIISILGALTLSVANTSCVCNQVPHFAKAQSLISDADQALHQAKSMLDLAPGVPADIREKFDAELQKAHAGLQKASQGLNEATQSCMVTDLPQIFADFNAAWAIIRNLIPVIASYSKSGQEKIGASPTGTPIVKDPVCFSIK